VAVAHAVVMVTPASGSLKLWPTTRAGSDHVAVAGVRSSRSLLLALDSDPMWMRTPFRMFA